MKIRLICAAAAAVSALPAGVLAQTGSSVQLYGQATASVTRISNQTGSSSLTSMGNSQFASSLFGLRGTEDLGDGMSAVFRFESGVNLANGAGGATIGGAQKLFNRQAFMGLSLGPAATVTIGRQFHAATDRVIQSLDVYNVSGTSLATTPLGLFGVNRFNGNDSRADSAIKLRLRGPAGLTGALSVARDAAVGNSRSLDIAQVTPGYALGAYIVSFDSPTIPAATGFRPSHTAWGLGGNAGVGSVRLYVHYMNAESDPTAAGRIVQENRIFSLGAAWSASPTTTVKAALYRDKGIAINGIAGRNGTKTTTVVSAEYALSKRTSVHAGVFTNRFADGYRLDPVNIAAMNRDPAASVTTGMTIGIRHDF